MSISIHIPFYNPNPQKKEGFRQLTRYEFLKENIENLKKLSIKNDIFVHTHNNYLDDKNLEAEIINHKISDNDLEKGHLTWLTRPMMKSQKNDYEYFMYLEHDIKFTEKNLQYYLKHQQKLGENKFHLGFLIYEKNHTDNLNYCIHVAKQFDKFYNIENQKYFINDFENYCCFWLYNKKIFNDFLSSKFWSFKNKLTNFRHNYGITERSALGLHALNVSYFKATLIPETNSKVDPDCFIEHITNNYFDRFLDENKKKFNDIRGVCKFHTNEIISEDKNQKQIKNNFYVIKFFKNLFWKFRFITRLIKK